MRPNIRISGSALVWLALLILVLPLKWLVAAFTAAIFHECCHILAIRSCGGGIGSIRVGERGASMDTTVLTRSQELFCALAGPAGSALLLLTANVFPRLAVCGLFHGLYNLLPVYPMDGGRALLCIAALIFGEDRAISICLWVTRLLCGAMLIVGVYAFFALRVGILPLLMAGFVIRKANMRKMPCKEGILAVQ